MNTISLSGLYNNLKHGFNIFRKDLIVPNKIRRRNYSSLHNDTRFIFSIASFFGIFPVQNIYRKNVSSIKARLYSIPYFYSFFMMSGFLMITIYGVKNVIYHRTFQIGEIKKSTAPFLFYGCCTMACYLFIGIAKKWPRIIRQWSKIEYEIGYINAPTASKGLAAFIMALGIVEHLFHNWINAKKGDRLDEGAVANYLKGFCFSSHKFLVDEQNYTHWKGLLIVLFSLSGTLLWTFIDVFIILVTSGLKAQLFSWNQFTYRYLQVSPNVSWRMFRRDYLKIINFVKLVDQTINKIVGLSLVNNFYFISAQLVEEVRVSRDNYSERVFLLFSFSFIILRAVTSFLSSASVYDEWKRVPMPIHASRSHSTEIERILAEIHSDCVCVTAFSLFFITRGLILTMFGVVLSYELLLVETNEAENMAELKSYNDSMN